MKNQYTGDIGDYSKLGMLRAINQAGFSLGINWYLTPDESSHSKTVTDGKYTDYLKSDCDTPDYELFEHLKRIVDSKKRAVKYLEHNNLWENTLFFDKILESKLRDKWHNQALKKLCCKDIIFCDPDNGLEVKNTKPTSKNGNKYITYQEAADYYKNGSSIIIYNHRDRKPETEYVKRFLKFREIKETVDAKMFYLRASRFFVRDYLFIIRGRHFSDLKNALNKFLTTEWSNYLTKYSI